MKDKSIIRGRSLLPILIINLEWLYSSISSSSSISSLTLTNVSLFNLLKGSTRFGETQLSSTTSKGRIRFGETLDGPEHLCWSEEFKLQSSSSTVCSKKWNESQSLNEKIQNWKSDKKNKTLLKAIMVVKYRGPKYISHIHVRTF